MSDFYSLQAVSLGGDAVRLDTLRGRVSLVVNVASECGYTPQYEGLQALHAELASRGFNVLGCPSNEFGGQEPGSAEDIQRFCSERYSVTFPMFDKLETKSGPNQSPIYALLGDALGELPKWNFGKYLISKSGEPLAYYASDVAPDDASLRTAIEGALIGS